MSKELQLKYNSLLNTYSYTFESGCGDTGNGSNDDIGNFDMLIQPFPFPEHNNSQRAIFKLHSLYIGGQTKLVGGRASASLDFDIGGFYLIVSGLGLSNNTNTTAKSCGKGRGNSFFIPNIDAGSDNAKSSVYQKLTGGVYNGPPVLCSNPTGTLLNFQLFDADTDLLVPANANLYSVINFSIELLPEEITSGRVA